METKKNDQNKTDLSLVDNQFVHGIARIMMYGEDKYGRDNWRLGTEYHRTFSATKRHIDAWWDGENNDQETGESHLYHAACNLMFLDYWQRHEKGTDDRYEEYIKHDEMWAELKKEEEKECDHCEKPYHFHNLTEDKKWCKEHWDILNTFNMKKLKEFKKLFIKHD